MINPDKCSIYMHFYTLYHHEFHTDNIIIARLAIYILLASSQGEDSFCNSKMPATTTVLTALQIATLAVLVVSLGLTGTSLGLIQANTFGGAYCDKFVSESQAINISLYNYNVPTCKLSLASAAIATVCLHGHTNCH